RVVPDGVYRLMLNQFEFYVTVDNTLPVIKAGLRDFYRYSNTCMVDVSGVFSHGDEYDTFNGKKCGSDREDVTIAGAPDYSVVDQNHMEYRVEVGVPASGI